MATLNYKERYYASDPTIPLSMHHISSAGVTVGEWEGRSAHRIVGTITFPNPNTLLIEGFGYDGGGVSEF